MVRKNSEFSTRQEAVRLTDTEEDGEHLLVSRVVIYLTRRQFLGDENNRPLFSFDNLEDRATDSVVGGVSV